MVSACLSRKLMKMKMGPCSSYPTVIVNQYPFLSFAKRASKRTRLFLKFDMYYGSSVSRLLMAVTSSLD